MSVMSLEAAQNLELVRKKKPLVHSITNLVTMNATANALLAAGASPVMAQAPEEVEEMVSLADALVLNLGTLSDQKTISMLKAGKKASELNIPVILDPVGSGATSFRTQSAKKLLDTVNIRVIRGNPSEIKSLGSSYSKTRGVDTVDSVDNIANIVQMIAIRSKAALAVTGPDDLVTDGKRTVRVLNGHPMMSCITGSGCMATALIAAFLAVDDDAVRAAASALSFFGIAGETAGEKSTGPGTFMVKLLDALYQITPEVLQKKVRAVGNY